VRLFDAFWRNPGYGPVSRQQRSPLDCAGQTSHYHHLLLSFPQRQGIKPTAMPRLFTAFEIPSDIRQSLALLRGGLPGARWVDPEDYHLTLRFIGDIDYGLADEIAEMLGQVARRRFSLNIDGLDSFGGNRPRALVAAVRPEAELVELQAEHER